MTTIPGRAPTARATASIASPAAERLPHPPGPRGARSRDPLDRGRRRALPPRPPRAARGPAFRRAGRRRPPAPSARRRPSPRAPPATRRVDRSRRRSRSPGSVTRWRRSPSDERTKAISSGIAERIRTSTSRSAPPLTRGCSRRPSAPGPGGSSPGPARRRLRNQSASRSWRSGDPVSTPSMPSRSCSRSRPSSGCIPLR